MNRILPMTHSHHLVLETERLWIQPLSFDQLRQYIQLDHSLEESLGLNPNERTLPGEMKEAMEQVILPQAAAAGPDLVYSTLWTIIDKEKKIMVGDLCFKGAPNAAGEIEIGYGTYRDFQGRGFMTEALGAITHWALQQPGVRAILAETDAENKSSHKTLSKNRFAVYQKVENMLWWRRDQ